MPLTKCNQIDCHCLSGQWAMSTGLGQKQQHRGLSALEQNINPARQVFFRISRKPCTLHSLTHTIFWTFATLMSKQIGRFQELVVKKSSAQDSVLCCICFCRQPYQCPKQAEIVIIFQSPVNHFQPTES